MNTQLSFTPKRLYVAILLALATPASIERSYAGAGFGDSSDKAGKPVKVQTFYANSPTGLRPAADCFDTTGYSAIPTIGGLCDSGTALRKFVDTLPGLGAAAANNLGQYIPVAKPDTVSYPGSDYYEIAVVEYAERMHSDLPKPTHLRGYVQLATGQVPGTVALVQADGKTPVLLPNGMQAYAVDKPHYLGPLISASKGRAVRIKYYNLLPTGTAGKLFIPVDYTLSGAGLGPDGKTSYSENRANVHWHGGDTPWVSDGTPHQWIAPAGDAAYSVIDPNTGLSMGKGASAHPVPDMPDPGNGAQTLYFPNNLSGRLMFYHDHTSGLTRLNVYAGIAAGYVITDPTEQALINAGTLPATQIPLVIQDKTFVPKDVAQQDAKWNKDINGNAANVWGQPGDLWFPHVYETNQDPGSLDGTNPVGRWDWGPWFWPIFPAKYSPPSGVVGDASSTPEAFMDTPVVNGTAYPTTTVEPKAYRFRILNAANDRYVNLGLYLADSEVSTVAVSSGGKGYSASPSVSIVNGAGDTTGNGAAAVATVVGGVITAITVTNPGTGYTAVPNLMITDTSGVGAKASVNMAVNTEVQMVPFNMTQNAATPFPATGGLQNTGWGTPDARSGGVPNPLKTGPDIVQIGTEGGFLPQAVTIPSTPVNYEYNKRSVTVLNVLEHGLFLGPAERADAVIDFSKFAGKTLILYNDAPAPLPAGDPRLDYYTADPDQSGSGGAATSLAGYGPNTRTILQIKVAATVSTPSNFAGIAALQAALPAAYAAQQAKPIVPEAAYNPAFGTNDSDNLLTISAGSINQPALSFTPSGPMALKSIQLLGGGTGYLSPPTVSISGGGGTGATAHAVINATSHMITSLVLDTAGTGYTSLPTVQFTPVNGGLGATATVISSTTQTLPILNKGIQELFDPLYGRMNATFSVELPYTSSTNQTTIPLAYMDPATEAVGDGETQIWKITHNGVDSHVVHFHLVNVQVINRVGWDGTLKPPYANELGWKETVRMNPLEDIYVAARAKKPQTNGFGLPQSVRPRDPSQALGSALGFTQIDPNTGNPATVVNVLDNFNNEYVWHCHILGHEENDFMRPVVFQPGGASLATGVRVESPLAAPLAPSLSLGGANADISWVDNSDKEFRFDIERQLVSNNTTATQPWIKVASALANAGMPGWITPGAFTDNLTTNSNNPKTANTTYNYRVSAVGAAATTLPIASLADVSSTMVSSYSNVVTVNALPAAPTGLVATSSVTAKQIALAWTDAASNETSYQVLRNGVLIASLAVNATSYTDADTALAANTLYTYTVQAVNSLGSAPSSVKVTSPAVPTAPGSLTATPTTTSVALNWVASVGETSYQVNRGISLIATLGTTATTATDSGLSPGTPYSYTVNAINAWGTTSSTVSSTTPMTVPTLPATPVTLSVGLQASFNWNAVPGAVSYNVQYRIGTTSTNGTWTNLPSTTASSVQISVPSGQFVAFQVAAVSASNVISAYATSPTVQAIGYTLAVAANGYGSVTSDVAGINCNNTSCSAIYPQNQKVTLTATPNQGYVFAGWSGGGCSSTATTCVVTLSNATSVTAQFNPGPWLPVIVDYLLND